MKSIVPIFSLFVLLLTGCAANYDIVYDYNMNVDFEKYSTFVLCNEDIFPEKTSHPKIDNEFNRSLIAREVSEQMEMRNHQTNIFEPELQAGFRIVVKKETVSFKDCSYSEEFSYWKECKITEETYNQESLILYVADFNTNTIIWQASTDCDLSKSKKNLKPYIKELVRRLYSTYPKLIKDSETF